MVTRQKRELLAQIERDGLAVEGLGMCIVKFARQLRAVEEQADSPGEPAASRTSMGNAPGGVGSSPTGSTNPPIAGVTPSVEECDKVYWTARDEANDRKQPEPWLAGISAVRDLCLAQAAERKGASREWTDESLGYRFRLLDTGALEMELTGGEWVLFSHDLSVAIRRLLSLTTPNAPGREETA